MLVRIIPARAGFTLYYVRARVCAWDHPRSRGVYDCRDSGGKDRAGSSPLARGLLDENACGGEAWGIIPARAGFTVRTMANTPSNEDHPRSRGVYSYSTRIRVSTVGSSPLARGLHKEKQCPPRTSRIIPARAGFTVPGAPWWGAGRDHPRSRGVYSSECAFFVFVVGSSPLARGLPMQFTTNARAVRIIPARAGFTPLRP